MNGLAEEVLQVRSPMRGDQNTDGLRVFQRVPVPPNMEVDKPLLVEEHSPLR